MKFSYFCDDRFRTFEHGLKDIGELIERWERASGMIRPVTPSDGQGEAAEDQGNVHPPSGKKGKKTGRCFDNKNLSIFRANLLQMYTLLTYIHQIIICISGFSHFSLPENSLSSKDFCSVFKTFYFQVIKKRLRNQKMLQRRTKPLQRRSRKKPKTQKR